MSFIDYFKEDTDTNTEEEEEVEYNPNRRFRSIIHDKIETNISKNKRDEYYKFCLRVIVETGMNEKDFSQIIKHKAASSILVVLVKVFDKITKRKEEIAVFPIVEYLLIVFMSGWSNAIMINSSIFDNLPNIVTKGMTWYGNVSRKLPNTTGELFFEPLKRKIKYVDGDMKKAIKLVNSVIRMKRYDEKIKIDSLELAKEYEKEFNEYLDVLTKNCYSDPQNTVLQNLRDYYSRRGHLKIMSKIFQKQALEEYEIKRKRSTVFSLPYDFEIYLTDNGHEASIWLESNVFEAEKTLVGMDCEWDYAGFNHKTVDIIQISIDKKCLLYSIKSGRTRVPPGLLKLLASEDVIKCWFGYEEDVQKITNWDPYVTFEFNGMVKIQDLSIKHNANLSMKEISKEVDLGVFLKDRITRVSMWSTPVSHLTEKQKNYAALDAYFCYICGLHFLKKDEDFFYKHIKNNVSAKSIKDEIESNKDNKKKGKQLEQLKKRESICKERQKVESSYPKIKDLQKKMKQVKDRKLKKKMLLLVSLRFGFKHLKKTFSKCKGDVFEVIKTLYEN